MSENIQVIVSLYYNMFDDLPAFKDKPELGDSPHAQVAMRAMGVSYREATPSPIADCWIFDGCDKIPEYDEKWLSVFVDGVKVK